LQVQEGGLFHFVLSADAAVQLQLFDSAGNLVQTGMVSAGDTTSFTVSLDAGNYLFSVSALGASSGPVHFTLKGTKIDDPIGPELVDPTLAPLPVGGTTTSSPTVSTNSYSFSSWNLSYYAFLTGTFSYYDPTTGQYRQTQTVPTYLP
jgi:hypothetical protein